MAGFALTRDWGRLIGRLVPVVLLLLGVLGGVFVPCKL